jgi:transcriptional regulator with XRE-family HTH domain
MTLDRKKFPNYNACVTINYGQFGSLLKQQRLNVRLTLQELARKGKVSASHLGRIERGQRFPSARILRRIAQPLGLTENEIFALAGYLSPQTTSASDDTHGNGGGHLDPVVARLLSQEPIEVQRQVISLLNIMKSLALSSADTAGFHKT